jgi:PLP dependent protein
MVTPLRQIEGQLVTTNGRIRDAAERAGRDPKEVQLVAVSKAHPASTVVETYGYGVRLFGESYVQEWIGKAEHSDLVGRPDLRWSFIGRLQRNKVRFLLGRVACIETVHNRRLAGEINKRAMQRGGGFRQPVLLQVNAEREASKAGFLPSELMTALPQLAELQGVRIDGLMHIPPFHTDPEATRGDHRALRALRDRLQDAHGIALPQLSMGMSGDYEVAIEEGATRVRVGTGIFGARPPRP